MKKLLLISLFIPLIWFDAVFSQEPENADSPDNVAMATEFVRQLRNGEFSGAVKNFDDTMTSQMPAVKLEETWNSLINQVGAFKKQKSTRSEIQGGYNLVFVTCEFEKSDLDIKVVFDKSKKIAGLFFAPVREPVEDITPGYIKSDTYSEREITVKTGEWILPGTLTMPNGKGPFPAVVLVHGSGPGDRDETVGGQKPFRDIAWGLASNGIAVLRYEKRTKQYAGKISKSAGRFTVKEESIDDALSAVALLRKTDGIDSKKIFVIGHSLGGMLIPRIGKLDSKIAGLISLAGPTIPLYEKILIQIKYLVLVDGVVSESDEVAIKVTEQKIAQIKAFKPSDIDSTVVLFGAPPAYWLDLRGYDPPSVAKTLKQPLLILQGERDYQVTMDDFKLWKTGLASKKNVIFKSYPKLNHVFSIGKGVSLPAEYEDPLHVDAGVISDIAAWIKEN